LCDTVGDGRKAFCVTQWETAGKRFSLVINWPERSTVKLSETNKRSRVRGTMPALRHTPSYGGA